VVGSLKLFMSFPPWSAEITTNQSCLFQLLLWFSTETVTFVIVNWNWEQAVERFVLLLCVHVWNEQVRAWAGDLHVHSFSTLSQDPTHGMHRNSFLFLEYIAKSSEKGPLCFCTLTKKRSKHMFVSLIMRDEINFCCFLAVCLLARWDYW
jgi:hypothetical protein